MTVRFAKEALPLEQTPVDNLFLLEYMPAADGTQLRVYLYGLMLCRYPAFSASPMHEALGLTEQEVLDACAYWQREGLMRILSADPLEVEYTAPSERPREPILLPGKYGELVQAAQQMFAPRTLRAQELRYLYDWVEVYNLTEEAVLELLSHCLSQKGVRVHVNYIDTVARAWASEGVSTLADAKEYAAAYEEKTGGAAAILKRWNKSRRPTRDELELYEKWTKGWGFTQEAVLAACPAVTKAERPSFQYLNGVLERLFREGTLTADAIAALFAAEDADSVLARDVFTAMGMGRAARPLERAQLAGYIAEGMEKDALLLAANKAQGKELPYAYLRTLIKELLDGGAKTAQQVQTLLDAREEKPSPGKRVKDSMDYPQKKYSDEEIAHIFVNLDEEA